MFKIAQQNPTFRVRVAISQPGKKSAGDIEFEFLYLSKSAVRAMYESIEGKTDAEVLSEIIVNWSGVDEPYSPDALERLIDLFPASAMDIHNAFRSELMEAKRKN